MIIIALQYPPQLDILLLRFLQSFLEVLVHLRSDFEARLVWMKVLLAPL